MSVTKFENAEGELISQVDIDPEKCSGKSSRCSCINCDSVGCFEKRKKAVKNLCQCSICRELRNSSTLANKDSRGNNRDLEKATKKIIREVVTRETIESLKRVTETMYEFGTKERFGMITKIQSKLSDEKMIPTPTKSQIGTKLVCCDKRLMDDKDITGKKESNKQRPILQTPSGNVDLPLKEGNTATKLSAQVMNVPYEDLHESIPSSRELTEQSPISKLNIFKRIKEIYEACSCKVCECISSKPRVLRDDFCKCEPCQCQDCVKLRKKIEEKIKRIPHSGCPCIRCDRKDCRGIAKITCEPQACHCSPSDNIQYPENLTKQCKCEPCQCINCRFLELRTSKSVKLGQVDEIIQRETCQCSPCECIECKQIYNRTNPTIMCTNSSDVTKYLNYCHCHNCRTQRCRLGAIEKCKCEKHKRSMRKPFDNNYNDYDVRTVIVDNNGPFNQQDESNFEEHKTVALFESLKNNYPNNSCNKSICKCTECECIVCSARDDSLRNHREHLRHNVMSLHNNILLPLPNTNACKCTPCECEVCSTKCEREDGLKFESKCRCDVCDCLNCDSASMATSSFPNSSIPSQSCSFPRRQPAKPIRNIDMNKNCECNPCDCSNCKKLLSCSSSVKFYSNGKTVKKKTQRLRKVMLITPSTSESHFKSQKAYIQSTSSTTLSSKQSVEGLFKQDLSTCHAVSHNNATMNKFSSSNKNPVCQLYENKKEYNIISNDDVDREFTLRLNNPLLDTASFKSVEEISPENYLCDFTQSTFKTDKTINPRQEKPTESKYKSFYNIIHENPDKINSNKSDESLPDFWTCSNRISYPESSSNDMKDSCIRSSLKDDVSHRLTNTQYPIIMQNDFNDLINDKSMKYLFNDNKKSIDSNIFTQYVGHSYYEHKHKNASNNDQDNLQQEPHKCNDYITTYIKDNNCEYKKTTVNHSDINIDYDRATRVLWEAKAFSSKLIKMLDSFETANRQFESASQKFKVLHESLLDINESEVNKTYNINIRTKPRPIFEDNFGIISEVHDSNRSINNKIKNENEAEREYEQSATKSEDILDKIQWTETPTISDSSETKHTNEINEQINDRNVQEHDVDVDKDIVIMQKSNSTSQVDNDFNKDDILPTDNIIHEDVPESTTLDSSAVDFNIETQNENVMNNMQTTTIASVMKKLNSVLDNITITDTAVATDDVEKNVVELSKQEDKQPWQIFKKNLYLNACPNNTKTAVHFPVLELDIKEACQAISLQSKSEIYPKVMQRPNEALINLQSEVNDLLNMPLLQVNSQFKYKTKPDGRLFPTSKLDLELTSMSSTASSQTYDRVIERADKEVNFNANSESDKVSCDQLKANFISLRRVSDHTVLVKWKMPKRITDVQGYELLVDGRGVQKILSPTRCMAVVTCLPHAPRVLLTVRTIASADCGHAPASSIVYRPRMK